MSIIDCCEKIGVEMRSTIQGQTAFNLYRQVESELHSVDFSLYRQIIEMHVQAEHFFSPDVANSIIISNTDTEDIGILCKNILRHTAPICYAEAMLPSGAFVNKVVDASLRPEAQYVLPNDITATPAIVRLVQDLSVQYQRTEFSKQLVSLSNNSREAFTKLLGAFEQLKARKRHIAFSSEDYAVVEDLVRQGHKRADVEIIYRLMSTLSYMKTAIYYGFFELIIVISEEDIEVIEEYSVNSYTYMKFNLKECSLPRLSDDKWILKLRYNNGKTCYCQITQKNISFNQSNGTLLTYTVAIIDYI